jgi:geranylgeranyl transferase type-2 subunit beta
MESEPYLLRLGRRLHAGLSGLSLQRRQRHRQFVLSRQNRDGGFSGREGDSDLYYTGFAVRTLAMLGDFAPEDCGRVAGYLRDRAAARLSVIDLVSWLYCALVVQAFGGIDVLDESDPNWPERLAELLEGFRTNDGGYAKSHEGTAGSTYHSFLIVQCHELIGRPIPRPNRLIQFLYDMQRDDGGFVEIAPMKRGGTNPTAAAVAVLTMLGRMDDDSRRDVHGFLKLVRSSEGGFQANTRVPFADGLSTFTGLLTSQDLGFDDLYDRRQMTAFIDSLEMPDGGFKGASWDAAADVEYTLYGLGTLALLGS